MSDLKGNNYYFTAQIFLEAPIHGDYMSKISLDFLL